jgi:ribonuclease VapC
LTTSPRRGFVIDTSAAVAVILGEAGSDEIVACLEAATVRLLSTASRVELGIVIEARLWPRGQDVVERFLRDAKIELVAVEADLAERAMRAWRRYSKGHHPAGLNFGDCFTYALAEQAGLPILCTSNDFLETDAAVERPKRRAADT